MNNIAIGVVSGIVIAGVVYYFYKKNKHKGKEGVPKNVQPSPVCEIKEVEIIDYDYILSWVKSNREKLKPGSSLNIIPHTATVETLKQSGLKEFPSENLISLALLDETENLVLAYSAIHYHKMADSLVDLLPKDKVFKQKIQ